MKKPEILVVDDEVEVCTFFEYYFREEKDYPVTVAYSGEMTKHYLEQKDFDLALVDLKLPDTDGISLLKILKNHNPHCEVIIMTGYSTVKSAVEAMKYEAFDYIDKPFDELNELDQIVDRALQCVESKQNFIAKELGSIASNFGIVMAENSPLKDILILAKKISTKRLSILIEGETGTGKELLARFIHTHSPRSGYPFIAINCGALSETLLESELFGHEKGAFSGALNKRKGIFEIANRGTLLLDEIGDATPAIQLKLLRVLETGEFFRVGGEEPIKTDVRILAATNKNLRKAVNERIFREDLLYRLDVVNLQLPPLKKRPMDLLPLINYFIAKNTADKNKSRNISFDQDALRYLFNYPWPGNVRELSNVVARALVIRGEETTLGLNCLPSYIVNHDVTCLQDKNESILPKEINQAVQQWNRELIKILKYHGTIDLGEITRIMEYETYNIIQEIIEHTLEKTHNDQGKAAELLNINRRTLRYLKNEKVKKLKND